MAVAGVVFDMDGVLLDSEPLWHEVRRGFVAEHGGAWGEDDQRAVMGDNSRQWAEYIRRRFAVPLGEEAIIAEVARRLRALYSAGDPPVLPGAPEAVAALAERWPLAVASSSPPEVIIAALGAAGLDAHFGVRVSSDDVAVGKPAPDVYLEACRRLGVTPAAAVAIEDSANGLRAAAAAGLVVVAVPSPAFAPGAEALAGADVVLESLDELTPDLVEGLA
ncbi:MAG TPA: HAD family phosphatase [Thermoleophilia bacterium]|nr:HAD family phosphatase [Thermoleophilia bacterium]